jgi:hypothetical protein
MLRQHFPGMREERVRSLLEIGEPQLALEELDAIPRRTTVPCSGCTAALHSHS